MTMIHAASAQPFKNDIYTAMTMVLCFPNTAIIVHILESRRSYNAFVLNN